MIASDKTERAAVSPVRAARRSLAPFERFPRLAPNVLGGLGLLGFFLAAGADGRLARLADTDAWRDLLAPILITYLLAVQPLLARERQEVAAALRARALASGHDPAEV
jgi:hypothetical protein